MRLAIDQRSIYRFRRPQARVIELLRVTPTDHAAQTVIDWRIDIDCDACLRHGVDGHGNATTMLYIAEPVTSLALTVRGEVLTEDQGGVVARAREPLPPIFFMRMTPATRCCDNVRALSSDAGDGDPLERISRLNTHLSTAVQVTGEDHAVDRTPGAILASGRGTARDAAHVLVAAARAAGCPARIVAGHRIAGPDRNPRRSAHYWGEVHIDGVGWVGFDPATGHCLDDSYVRVAVGLDGAHAASVSGTRFGGGVEELDVDPGVEAAG